MSSGNKLFAWQETKPGLLFVAVFDLLITYIFASFAISTGSLLDYSIAIIFLILALAAIVKLVKKVLHRARP